VHSLYGHILSVRPERQPCLFVKHETVHKKKRKGKAKKNIKNGAVDGVFGADKHLETHQDHPVRSQSRWDHPAAILTVDPDESSQQ
jgi:hypothetical protein